MERDPTDGNFERELRDLLLTAFADGEAITGEWTMQTVPDQLPDWQVTVERQDGDSYRSRGTVVGESD